MELTGREAARISRLLRAEFVSGILVMAAALAGFVAANSPLASGYFALRDTSIGPAALHLDLTVGQWASDGLLAVFFFVVGLELKREFAFGALRRFGTAVVPVAAAFGGVAVPAVIYLAVNLGNGTERGWAIPSATDIAFAVAVLGLIAPRIPASLRIFLLTLAVVDDLIAITIIALFYSGGVALVPLLLSLLAIAVFGLLARRFSPWFAARKWPAWAVLLPIGIVAWALMHASGVHATVAGVLLAFAVPVSAGRRTGIAGGGTSDLAGDFAHRFAPLSAGIAVPVFAFFAAGVAVGGESRFPLDPIALGVMLGMVVGKPLGIVLTTWAITRFSRAELGDNASWREVIGIGCLAGIGFTVALLLAELSFADAADADTARLAVMAGSLVSAAIAAAFLVRRPVSRASGRARSRRAPA
jgi:NhaA family Na+:H+ antiporter